MTTDEKETAGGQVSLDRRLKALIVEDEFFIALDIQAQLEGLGFTIVGIATSAEQAVSLADIEKPDLVMMDIRLSGAADGIDAALEIRSRHAFPIVFLTANADPHTRERANLVEPDAFLEKPLSHDRLAQTVT